MALYDGIWGAPKPDLVLLETYGYATIIKTQPVHGIKPPDNICVTKIERIKVIIQSTETRWD